MFLPFSRSALDLLIGQIASKRLEIAYGGMGAASRRRAYDLRKR